MKTKQISIILFSKFENLDVDGKFYSSSGVNAGIGITLEFLSDLYGEDFAKNMAKEIEFN